ncbi:HEAT repeat domain-containing protein [Neorhodopirellula lusitana]|uniref:HEAT repeat domain-containing protein n=1 Tax=Neorhodopirellula lusitana TaxID=445327 RepID=UPI003850F042
MPSHHDNHYRNPHAQPGETQSLPGQSAPAQSSFREQMHSHGDHPASNSNAWDPSTPNPFSLALAAKPESSTGARLWRGIKTLVATIAVTAVLLSAVFFGKQYLLHRLVTDLDQLEPAEKQSRLVQIASFGDSAIEPLVERLVDPADDVSESAFVLLQRMQNDWTTLQSDAALTAHNRLLQAIHRTYNTAKTAQPDQLTQKQLARGRELIRQTLLEFSGKSLPEDATEDKANILVSNAQKLLNHLEAANPSAQTPILASAPQPRDRHPRVPSPNSPGQTADSALQSRSGWTDWPPPANHSTTKSQPAQIVRSGPKRISQYDASSLATNDSATPTHGLHPLPQGVTAPLAPVSPTPARPEPRSKVAQPSPRIVAARRPTESTIQMATHLSESPLSVLDDETVIRHLANPDAMVASQARTELVQRGFSDPQLEMATAIATSNGKGRIRLIDSLVHSSQLNAGPWLSMMLDDPDRQVRLHVASTLASNKDPAILERLRQRLAREDDDYVATRLRRILDLR